MSDEQLKVFSKRVDEIQSKCACPCIDAKDCMDVRYPRNEWEDPDDQRCECGCHSEIAEEYESQDWP